MKLKPFSLAVAGLLATSAMASAAPGDEIGSAIMVVNLVTAELNRDTRSLKTGDGVRQQENIEVGSDATGELKFNDETKVALGPGSHLKLDKFVYDPEKNTGSIILNIAKGSFRFITGIAAKRSYVIRIPNASITVRGTILDGHLLPDGTAWLLLHEGSFETCNDRGRCRLHDEPGKLIRVMPNGDVGAKVKWAGLPGSNNTPFDRAFPFVVKAPSFDPNPIFTPEVIILGNLPETGNGQETEDDKPRKPSVRKVDTEPRKETKKRARTAKSKDSDDNIVSGMDIVIGVGVGIGKFGKGKHKGGGEPHTGPSGGKTMEMPR
jgi:hypothetical protein